MSIAEPELTVPPVAMEAVTDADDPTMHWSRTERVPVNCTDPTVDRSVRQLPDPVVDMQDPEWMAPPAESVDPHSDMPVTDSRDPMHTLASTVNALTCDVPDWEVRALPSVTVDPTVRDDAVSMFPATEVVEPAASVPLIDAAAPITALPPADKN